ncbi:hypothetical protein GHT09_002146 [Marmota monax]|uniref:Rootletin-like coiled-coil domain-containing protein n=1 Tax=Marmota monax TaxID=9995 RepID=A0A834UQD5_MARMO|nr:hypothetical protein GHT09_002146 [Marmota monax]
MASLLSLQEENQLLQQELSRVEDLLAQSCAERDELAIKYSAASERLEQAMQLESGELEPQEPPGLVRQSVELRRQLQEEQASYRRKLQAYQEGQQRQAQLVQRLQAKILQYKKRCSELEQQLLERSTELEQQRLRDTEHSQDLESALLRLEEEQQRSASLAQVNAMLREQLDQAGSANQALSEDIRKVTSDWTRSCKELEQREAAWRREEESFNAYCSNEHNRLLLLWRKVVGFRRLVSEVKMGTERDLRQLGGELARTSRAVQEVGLGLSAGLKLAESRAQAAQEKQVLLQAQLEEQLQAKVLQEKDLSQLQVQSDLDKAELSARWVVVTLFKFSFPTEGHLETRGGGLSVPRIRPYFCLGSARLPRSLCGTQRALSQGTS